MTETQLDSFVEMTLTQEASRWHADMIELSYPVKIIDLMEEEQKDFSIQKRMISKCVPKACFCAKLQKPWQTSSSVCLRCKLKRQPEIFQLTLNYLLLY